MNKLMVIMAIVVLFFISGCNNRNVPGNFLLDLDWKKDVYNLVYTKVSDVENFQYWIRQFSDRTENSPHQIACIEVKEVMQPNKFYIANLDFYSMKKVRDCDLSYALYMNQQISNNEESYVTDINNNNDNFRNIFLNEDRNSSNSYKEDQNKLDLKKYYNSKYIRLIFSDLFPVNEFRLTENGQKKLLEVIKEISSLPVKELVVYGVADSSGDYFKNKQLASNRAESVHTFLTKNGLVNVPIYLKGSVENGESTVEQRIYQRRFFIEVKLK